MRRALLFAGLFAAAGAVILAGWLVLLPGPTPTPAPPVPEAVVAPAPDVVPPAGMADVGGVVVDEGGLPVPGAEAYLLAPGSLVVPREPPERDRTDAGGRFALRRPADEVMDLIVSTSGFRPAIVPAAGAGDSHRIALSRGRTLAGSVRDDLGRPLAGAAVVVRAAGSELDPERGIWLPSAGAIPLSYGRALTGPAGEFRLEGLAEGDLEVRAAKAGYPSQEGFSGPVRAGGAPVEIVLPRPFVAEVTVVDADSGRALSGVAVEVQIETGGEPVRARGRTGAGGLFRTVLPFPAEGAPDAPAGIVVFSDRRGGTRRESLPLRAVAEGAGFRVALSSGEPGTVRVKVMRDDGTPEVRWVMLRFEAAGGAEVMRWTALGSEGTGEFQVPPGRYDSVGLAVGQPFGDARRAASAGGLDVAPGSTTDLSFTVPRGADLELRLPGAQDRAQVELRCGEETFHSSIWGRMRVTDLPPGTLTVVVTRNGKSPVERTVTLVRGAMTTVEFP